jgi:hypothetical protein
MCKRGFDVSGELPTAPESVWQQFLAKWPRGEKFRTQKLRYFDQLNALYFGAEATGRYVMAPPQLAGKRAGAAAHEPPRRRPDTPPSLPPTEHGRKRPAPARPSAPRKRQQRSTSSLEAPRTVEGSARERAVGRFQQEYRGGKFPVKKMAEAFNIFLDDANPEIFLALEPGRGRDLWVEREIRNLKE